MTRRSRSLAPVLSLSLAVSLALGVAACGTGEPAFDTVQVTCADGAESATRRGDAMVIRCDRGPTLAGPADGRDTLEGFVTAAGVDSADAGVDTANIDWDRVPPVAMTLGDLGLTPVDAEFSADVPARLVLHNPSDEVQRFSAGELLATAQCSRLRVLPPELPVIGTVDLPPRQVRPAGQVFELSDVPCPSAIRVRPGEFAELSFIPGESGTFAARCEPCGAATFAQDGTIRVVR
jgi:hypothetical protein